MWRKPDRRSRVKSGVLNTPLLRRAQQPIFRKYKRDREGKNRDLHILSPKFMEKPTFIYELQVPNLS
ncbi:hypothetical protein Lalb_Chr04g0256821 [Lupinus albus]|uniref:Uncharacterized protein n=1 Tax=Lupinus albus TaxID=3870 RepID=A0A6A4QNT4_LUPAL|nr:hypothetical protein Lalb_Chr04g0256821 [Lupinus albus]